LAAVDSSVTNLTNDLKKYNQNFLRGNQHPDFIGSALPLYTAMFVRLSAR
jgi:hypothetical protein